MQYSDLPFICAKAHWYMGWIYADLLQQKKKSIFHYQTVVDHYPDVTKKLEPPVPWVSFVVPQLVDKPQTIYQRPAYFWRSMALLEIIRNSDDDDKKWDAFSKLWAYDRMGPATSHALRHLMRGSPALVQKAADYARLNLEARLFSPHVAAEIRQILSRLDLDSDGAP